VRLRVLGREPSEGHAKLKPLLEVGRARAASLRIDEVGQRDGPRRFEQVLNAG
jgi:hypothetical protein